MFQESFCLVPFNFIWQERMPVPFTRTGCRMGLGTNWQRSKGCFLKNDKTLTSLKDPRALGEVNQEGIQGSPRGDDYKEEVL